ncbi:MAG TPA: Zn-dependent alcohol dehydrogenase [Mycobacteriales bacterium]|nr:Zn-dependent alcohol dehydrogenase [Mycobacteriales bacterium]
MKATVLYAVGEAPVIEELTLRDPGPNDVKVRLAASGVCHSDLSIVDGGMPSMLPCSLGHEGAGVVTEIGSDVTTVKEGDRVGLTWNVACRTCFHCLRGETYLCPSGMGYIYDAPYAEGPRGPVWFALGAGTLAEETVIPAAAVIPLPSELPLDLAALLGCGVTTGAGAVLRTAQVKPGETVVVIGCGGVGLAAIQGARLAGASRIIAADRVAGQLAAATSNGATDVIDTSAVDLPSAVRELTGGIGADHAIEVVGKPDAILAAYASARRGGIVTLVGAGRYDESVTFGALSLMADSKQIRGSVYGETDATRDLPVLADLAVRGKLDLAALVTRRIGLADVNDAFDRMARGDGARTIVIFG